MKSLRTTFGLAFALILLQLQVSCETPSINPAPEPAPDASFQNLTGNDSDFVGMLLRQAEALAKKRKLAFRVIKINGKPQMMTKDYNLNRVNFTTKMGKVTETGRG